MKYMITGGFGFLGSNLSEHILRRGFDLLVVDNESRLGSSENAKRLKGKYRFQSLLLDIREYDKLSDIVRSFQPDVIFHLAGQVAMTTSITNPRYDFEVNVLGTLNILEAIRNHSDHTGLIYSSTNKVYGDLMQYDYRVDGYRYVLPDFPEGLDESLPLNFHSPYGCSKGAAEQYVLDYARIYGLRTAVFRHSSMYGGYQFPTTDQGWIGWFCKQAFLQRMNRIGPFTISGDGLQVRDILHVDDMVGLYMRSAHLLNEVSGHAFNIGGGIENSFSVLELLQSLENILDVALNYEHIPARKSDQLYFVADLKKIRSFTGWQPRIGGVEGLEKMLQWIEALEEK